MVLLVEREKGPGLLVGRDLKTLVRVDADIEGGAEAVGLPLEIGSTRLNKVDDAESDGVDDVLDLPEDSSNRLADDGDGGEEASLADEDVQESLVDADEFAECIEDGVSLSTSLDGLRAVHLSDGNSDSGDDVGETSNDRGEGSLANDDERSVDNGDGLGRCLESLALGGDHLDVVDHLGRGKSRRDGSSESQSGSKDVADGDHFCGCKRSFCC